MEVVYKDKAIEDIKFWKKSGQKITQNKISRLWPAGLVATLLAHYFDQDLNQFQLHSLKSLNL